VLSLPKVRKYAKTGKAEGELRTLGLQAVYGYVGSSLRGSHVAVPPPTTKKLMLHVR
jgi:hypothetical protein